MSKTVVIETPAPRNALEAVHFALEKFPADERDFTSTPGIQGNIKALWASINALALFVDGESQPIKHRIVVPDSVADARIAESRPDAAHDPEQSVAVA